MNNFSLSLGKPKLRFQSIKEDIDNTVNQSKLAKPPGKYV